MTKSVITDIDYSSKKISTVASNQRPSTVSEHDNSWALNLNGTTGTL